MTNKAICHSNNVNNKNQSKSSHSLLSSSNKAAAATPTSSTQSCSSSSSLSNGKSNNTSNTSQINNTNSSNNNIKLCVGVGCANDDDDGGGGAGGRLIKAYAHGIWYQEYDTIDNSVQQHIQLLQQQRQRLYNNNVRTTISANGEDAGGNVLRPDNKQMENSKQQQRQHKGGIKDNNNNKHDTNPNNCDIVVVDIEDEQLYEESATTSQQPPPTNRTSSSQYRINAAVRNDRHTLRAESITKRQDSVVGHVVVGRCDNFASNGRGDDDDVDDDDDSLASMETLSDNVSIWIDGEKHWIAGVDAQTTCADLIWALLNYQNGQPEHTLNAIQGGGIDGQVNSDTLGHYEGKSKEQQEQAYRWTNKDMETQTQIVNSNKVSGHASTSSHTSHTASTGNINQSMPKHTKEEHFKITQNSSRLTPLPVQQITLTTTTTTGAGCNGTTGLPCAPVTTFQLPPGITTAAQLTTEYVIVKQYHHCEEYLDASTKVFDVLPPRNSQHKKECELMLRRLGPAPMSVYANNTTTTPQLSSLISTDKDSGMGSPVGSARSAKFRRRKHKSSQWLAQANTLHPKLSRCTATANERLLKIILAQDETIQRQLSLLREKERQINKIEEEKHRKRERELGKNYLLETYLNGLDEADCEPEQQEGEEIFIDEPYAHHAPKSSMLATSDSGATTNILMTSQKDPLNMEMLTLDNFKPKDGKKDKKKKRHKEKTHTKDETNISKAKDKEEKLLRLCGHETSNIPGSIVNDNETNEDDGVGQANKKEMEMQIFWWEKVYTLNKQLQKEEELSAKLHAKIRKHQLKKANQTQKEVQLEIDKLDNGLALQCGNIRRVEANLMETNDQLQKKLLILERLSLDYLRQQDREQAEEGKQNLANEQRIPTTQQPTISYSAQTLPEKSSEEIHKLSLSNIKSAEEVEKLQKLIAKPGFDEQCTESKETNAATNTINPVSCTQTNDGDVDANADPAAALAQLQHHIGETPSNPAFVSNSEKQLISNSTKSKALSTTALITTPPIVPLKTLHDVQQPMVVLRATTTPPSLASSSATSSSTTKTMSQVSVLLDKNMLSSLHVQNAKTIKKQMFHSQTTTTTSTATPPASAPPPPPTAPSPLNTSTAKSPTPILTENANLPKANEINAFPMKQQQQQQQFQNSQQHMQLPLSPPLPLPTMTMSSSIASPATIPPALITSRPTHLPYQPPSCSVVLVARQPAVSVAAAASLAPIQATMAMTLPASSSSSPSSLMAMNTVDISQLGTLV